jgi:ABC transporter, phosphonate, periplasmic substrate-binding protein
MTTARGDGPLRFATFLAPNMLPVYRFLADRIGQRLHRPVELVVGSTFDQFEQGQVDLGMLCGLPYVRLAAKQPPPVEPLAAPVLGGDRYGGRPIYYSDVIVRRDSPITGLEQLRGRSWAFNEPASTPATPSPSTAWSKEGLGPDSWAGWLRPGSTSGPSVWSRPAWSMPPQSTPRSWPSSAVTTPGWPPASASSTPLGLHHPTRRGRQPPRRAAQGWGPGAAGWTGR